MSIRGRVSQAIGRLTNSIRSVNWRLPDVDPAVREIYHRVAEFTMTSPERIAAVCDAVRYVTAARISGAYVK